LIFDNLLRSLNLNQRSVYTRAHQVFADDFENPVLGHFSYHRDW